MRPCKTTPQYELGGRVMWRISVGPDLNPRLNLQTGQDYNLWRCVWLDKPNSYNTVVHAEFYKQAIVAIVYTY